MAEMAGMSEMAGMQGSAPAAVPEKRGGISGSTVKIIAVIAMLIDHAAAVVLARQLMDRGLMNAIWGGQTVLEEWLKDNLALYAVYIVMRGIGRLGFPIFCFLLVEGFEKTRNVKKYGLRLAVFAAVSEIPFNLALTGKVTASGYQNVFFTLFLGLFALCVFRFFERCRQSGLFSRVPKILWGVFMVTGVLFPGIYFGIWLGIQFFSVSGGEVKDYLSFSRYFPPRFAVLCAAVCVGLVAALVLYGKKKGMEGVKAVCADMTALVLIVYLADLLRTDYGGIGVLTIAVMYALRRHRVGAMAAGCGVLTLMSVSELPAFLVLIPVALYNGRRGLRMKYFFYAFYPVHLFLLYLIAVWMGMGSISAV